MRTKGDLTPVIAITGGDPRSPQSTSVDVALSVGANRALSKPVTKAVLLETIRECIGLEEKAPERTV
jgi:CheY-like chemotaxis protein